MWYTQKGFTDMSLMKRLFWEVRSEVREPTRIQMFARSCHRPLLWRPTRSAQSYQHAVRAGVVAVASGVLPGKCLTAYSSGRKKHTYNIWWLLRGNSFCGDQFQATNVKSVSVELGRDAEWQILYRISIMQHNRCM